MWKTTRLISCSTLRSVKRTNSVLFRKQYSSHVKNILPLTDQFLGRHIGPNDKETKEMLSLLGYNDLDSFIDSTVPKDIRLEKEMQLPPALSETEALNKLRIISKKNKTYKSFIGMGYYDCITPNVILRNLLENPGWYTAYTPYQAEVSQGRLESLLNFQTMVSDLTGLPIANASLLDEGTAAAEAMYLCYGALNGKRKKFFVSEDCHPQTISVVETRAKGFGIEVVLGKPEEVNFESKEYCGILLQYPNTYGSVEDYSNIIKDAKSSGSLVVMAADLMSLTMIKPPGELGADVAVGSAQRFGVPMMFGGPHAGYIATSEKYHRKIPGRIIGVSIDSNGNNALRMAMQTREQHIRRDKATSNICTAQALLANIAACYGVYHGPHGLKSIANRLNKMASIIVAGLQSSDCKVINSNYFDTIIVDVSKAGLTAEGVRSAAVLHEINLRVIDEFTVGISMGESTTSEDLIHILNSFGITEFELNDLIDQSNSLQERSIPASLKRESDFMTHPVFNTHHSETQMLRYLKSLENKDLSLNTSMISLGSCTMKLNAVSELAPVSWPEFSGIHPFVPRDQCQGYLEMIDGLHGALTKITGFAAMSGQPNSGAQGEYAGLMCIKKYQESQNESKRNVCLIPISAHGTNPASAVMAGMKVVVLKSDANGNIDRQDLKEKVEKHKDDLCALMLTYPSTFGVYEEGVKDICKLIHDNGGQVYMDGANMNAQVGLCNPYELGADVCHLNLHKTFCIPHGGGGPGVGTIGVAEHLAPFLPGNCVIHTGGEGKNVSAKPDNAIASAPFGSAGILPISWMYIHMLGADGLKKATSYAVLNANYMASILENHYDIVYRGKNGRCAHEFIIDIRPFKKIGIVEEDIAKRLQDYGFHSPTMSWPVSGTLMIEPTESEDKAELDRFCDAMIGIRNEIKEIESGVIDVANSPLKLAPHTQEIICSSNWERQYSREVGAFPAKWQLNGRNKTFWPTVGRVNNVHGDRNLICTCPSVESYIEN